jgi:hypothetical protein
MEEQTEDKTPAPTSAPDAPKKVEKGVKINYQA